MSKISKAAIAATLACGLGTSAGAVTPIFLQSAGIYNPGTIYVTTGGNTTNDYASDVLFHANLGTKPGPLEFDLIGFCVDIFHNISVGIGGQQEIDLPYYADKLLTDSNGKKLRPVQIKEIGGLATLGFAVAKQKTKDQAADLAAIQGAIWTIEYPASSFKASGGFGDLQDRIDYFVSLAPKLSGTAYTIYPTNGKTQGFIVGVSGKPGKFLNPLNFSGAVPEPETWGLMLAGFGMVGMAARRRSRTRTVMA